MHAARGLPARSARAGVTPAPVRASPRWNLATRARPRSGLVGPQPQVLQMSTSLRPTQFISAVAAMPAPRQPVSIGHALTISIVGTTLLSIAATQLLGLFGR